MEGNAHGECALRLAEECHLVLHNEEGVFTRLDADGTGGSMLDLTLSSFSLSARVSGWKCVGLPSDHLLSILCVR